ncbi:MAG: hypothetical protein GEV11_01045 [Streptosporangiales bacterium]|nr:hypothetical protein [Streptosporangiales bacterium]
MERRTLLTGAAATAAAPALVKTHAQPGARDSAPVGQVAALRLATTAFRRMEGVTPSRMLSDPVLAHLRLVQTLAGEMDDPDERARLAALGSEVASFAAWLAWDMADHGSARTWYGTAVKAARRSRNRLLVAYQLGSLAQMEAHMGNAQQGLSLIRAARSNLGEQPPAVAAGWLSATEAVAHAAGGDSQLAADALTRAATAVERVGEQDAPPWPWVFIFDAARVESFRVTCGALLGLPQWTAAAYRGARGVLTGEHDKQRALLLLDFASGQLAAGQLDGAFLLATRAVDIGLQRRSGRIIDRARALRRAYTSPSPPKAIRDFDDRLHSAYI